jgi:hypothetical protein
MNVFCKRSRATNEPLDLYLDALTLTDPADHSTGKAVAAELHRFLTEHGAPHVANAVTPHLARVICDAVNAEIERQPTTPPDRSISGS